jgi:hypothetical protein
MTPTANELIEQVSRQALCAQIESWMPQFSKLAQETFDHILAGNKVKTHRELSMDDLKSLYNLCHRTYALEPVSP